MVGVTKGHDPKWVGKGGDGCITTKSVSMSVRFLSFMWGWEPSRAFSFNLITSEGSKPD